MTFSQAGRKGLGGGEKTSWLVIPNQVWLLACSEHPGLSEQGSGQTHKHWALYCYCVVFQTYSLGRNACVGVFSFHYRCGWRTDSPWEISPSTCHVKTSFIIIMAISVSLLHAPVGDELLCRRSLRDAAGLRSAAAAPPLFWASGEKEKTTAEEEWVFINHHKSNAARYIYLIWSELVELVY